MHKTKHVHRSHFFLVLPILKDNFFKSKRLVSSSNVFLNKYYYLKFALMDYRRKRWCHFVGIATKWLCKFNPYQTNHVHSTKDGGRGKLSCKYDSTPVTSTWWYQSCSKVHISPLEDYGCPEKAMSTVRPACVPPAPLPCGISCRRKATPARSSGPEAVGASTPLM